MAETLAASSGGPVDVFGHSYGGRCALGAALLTDAIRRVISYEGAPTPPGSSYHPPGIEARLRERLAAGDNDGALAAFLTEVVGMSAADLAAYQADPIWPVRAAAAGTILRELEAEADPAASLDRLGSVRQPVLQLLGGESLPVFRDATSPSTRGWPTVASSSSTAPATRPTTRIPTRSSARSRRSWPDEAGQPPAAWGRCEVSAGANRTTEELIDQSADLDRLVPPWHVAGAFDDLQFASWKPVGKGMPRLDRAGGICPTRRSD